VWVNADKLLHVPQHCRHVRARQIFVLHQCRTGPRKELAITTRAGPGMQNLLQPRLCTLLRRRNGRPLSWSLPE
jgi:hypothetical protein